jgi:hypothetical protein
MLGGSEIPLDNSKVSAAGRGNWKVGVDRRRRQKVMNPERKREEGRVEIGAEAGLGRAARASSKSVFCHSPCCVGRGTAEQL